MRIRFDSSDGSFLDHPAFEKKGIEGDGDTAVERVLLYLRCLQFSPSEAVAIAFGALKAAGNTSNRSPGRNSQAEVMQALWKLLEEGQRHQRRPSADFLAVRCRCSFPASPPLHRLHMIPEETVSAKRGSLFTKFINRFR